MKRKVWEIFPLLTERIYCDHAEAGMLDDAHNPEHAARVAQMALELAADKYKDYGELAAAAGLCHNADRILQKKLGIGRHEVLKEKVEELVRVQLSSEDEERSLGCHAKFDVADTHAIVDAVLKHDGKNNDGDSPVLVLLMDADRLVNAEPDLVIRGAQHYVDLPAVDFVHLWEDPTANYRNPKSVLRDIMETLDWLRPGTPFYVRTPKAREIAKRRKKFFDDFGAQLIACLEETGFCPFPPELLALRKKFKAAT